VPSAPLSRLSCPAPWRSVGTGLLAVFSLAFVLGALALDRPPRHDELYHLLAARGLIATGDPRIGDGVYVRGLEYTYLVALGFRILGESVPTARLPALLAGSLIPVLLFWWLYRNNHHAAAWIAAIGYATSPFFLQISPFARFYTLQILAFLAGTILMEKAVRTSSWVAARRGGLASIFLALATKLQPVTLFGIGGLGAWLLFWRLPDLWRRNRGWRWGVAIGAVSLALALWFFSDLFASLWIRYRTAEGFHARFRDAVWFYHVWYQIYYPGLWSLTPVLTLFALLRSPKMGSLSVFIFLTSFLLASFAAAKGNRYLAFAQPFLFTLWGLGAAEMMARLRPLYAHLPSRLAVGSLFLPTRLLLALGLGAFLLLQPFWVRTGAFLADITLPFEVPDARWELARPALRPWAERVDVVVGPHDVYNFYYLGRHDVTFEPSKYHEMRDQPRGPWRWDPRTGRPLVADAKVLARLIRCHRSGLFVVAAGYRGQEAVFPRAAERVLEEFARPLPLPVKSGLLAYAWEHTSPIEKEDCRELSLSPAREEKVR